VLRDGGQGDGDDRRVRATLRGLRCDPEPATLAADPASFMFLARLIVGLNVGLVVGAVVGRW